MGDDSNAPPKPKSGIIESKPLFGSVNKEDSRKKSDSDE